MATRTLAFVCMSILPLACFDPKVDGDGTDTATTTDAPPGSTSVDPPGTTTGTSQGTTSGTEGGTTSTSGTGTTMGADGTTAVDSEADTSPVIFDLGILPDSPPERCPEGGPDLQLSSIWIANSTQGTISKIDTETLVEEGRYQTRPDTQGSPSRTSVSLAGNVAVANRSGGLTKFYGDPADCPDADGDGSLDTSNGAGDILAWGQEECLAWHTPMAYISQRPVAWTQGELDRVACTTVNEKLWTSGSPDGTDVEVLFVDGDTGIIEETIPIPGVPAGYFGIYGAAVDSEGNFWGSQLGQGTLVNVNRQTLAVQTWPMAASGYGMTVDQEGYVWTCSNTVARFDPATETWQQAVVGGSGGCMSDGADMLWMASSPLVGINRQTLAIDYSIPLPEYVHGVSIDYQGYVWGVGMNDTAYRVDPDNGSWDPVTGLIAPYTYSDMTGFALDIVSD
jgi:hypothetical protein